MKGRRKRLAVILAGGRSRRFGRDKSKALWRGRTLLEWTIRHARRAGFQTIIRRAHHDPFPGEGPLQALFGLWRRCDPARILLLPCDMPWLNPKILRRLWKESASFDVTLLRTPRRIYPLPGVYSRKAAHRAEKFFAKGRKDLKSLINKKTHFLFWKEAKQLTNVNFPRDLLFAGEQFGKQGQKNHQRKRTPDTNIGPR